MYPRPPILLLLLILFAIPLIGHSQRIFLNEALRPTSEADAVFYAEAIGLDSGRVQAKVMDMDGVLKAVGDFTGSSLETPDGHFTYYYPDGTIESQGDYAMGHKDGLWLRYDSAGQPLAEKVYDNSLLNDLVFTQAQQMPSCTGGQRALVRQVQSRFGKLKGHPTALFIVEKDGKLSDIKVLGAETKEVADQLVALLGSSPAWASGLQYGQPVRVQMRVPLK